MKAQGSSGLGRFLLVGGLSKGAGTGTLEEGAGV